MTDRILYQVKETDAGREVQYLLRERLHFSSGMVKLLKYNAGILLDGVPVRGTACVTPGQTVTALLNCKKSVPDILPEPFSLEILYEDDAFTAINKPADTVIHPTCRHQTGTLSNYLLSHWQKKGIDTDIHLVGRLDKDTTGLVLAARNGYVQEALKKQSETGELRKFYLAAVSPVPERSSGTIDAPIMRDLDSMIKRKIALPPEEGRRAVTHYRVMESRDGFAILEFWLETGRTHQIRLHCSSTGFPIIGDTLYGTETVPARAPHQLLHAYKLEFTHPVTGERICLTVPPPAEWGAYAPLTLP